MKTLKFLSFFFSLGALAMLAMSFTNQTSFESQALTALRPDLKVSAIATPGGLCIGKDSKVRVSITNSQMVGVKVDIPVILFVSQNGYSKSYVGKLKGGIGPNANSGQPVWFKNVEIKNNSKVTLKAVVNPDHEIFESVPNNNTKIIYARVKGNCGQASPAQAANMIVTVYKDGTWSGGQGQPISGATVTVTKNGQNYTGTSGNNGKATINSVPKGYCKIKVQKNGYQQVGPNSQPYYNGQTYNMPTYEAKVNIAMIQN
ncbi:MAG: hypothetical protein HKN76_21940 [Saprospiraceae bacterium]|nr:hypothetical protein [Saprospiraceae bacterium]